MVNNKKNQVNKKGQGFSADILIVVVIVLFGALFLVMKNIDNQKNNVNVEELFTQASEDSGLILEELKKKEIIDSGNNIELKDLQSLDINELKEELNIQGDVAFVFEKDGKLIKIDAENNVNCIGSSKIIVNGVPCKSN